MPEHMEWTNELVIRLVREYEKRPEIWNSNHDLYRVFTAKHEAWEELAAIFECETSDIKKKINSVLASHRREKAKVRIGGHSTWFLYPHMKFLPTHVVNGDSLADDFNEESQTTDLEQTEYLEIPSEDLTEEIVIKEEVRPRKTVRLSTRNERRNTSHKPRLLKPIKRRHITHSSTVQNHSANDSALEILKTMRKSDMFRKKDECDSFGEYIANSLRKHDERTRSMIKHAINNILFEQEMKKYSGGHYQVAVVEDDEDQNPLILGDQMQDS